MTLFGHGHSHGRVEEAKPLKEFTYLPAMEEVGVNAEKTTLTLSSVGDPPPKYTSHCPSVATSETGQVNRVRNALKIKRDHLGIFPNMERGWGVIAFPKSYFDSAAQLRRPEKQGKIRPKFSNRGGGVAHLGKCPK